jgi:hypothetical protein
VYIAGHSLHTTAKPTFNNRKPNPLWWTKAQEGSNGEVDDAARRRAEIAAIKREEEQLHQEALYVAAAAAAAAGVDPAIFSREASEGLLAD